MSATIAWRRRVADLALAAGLAVVGVLETTVPFSSRAGHGSLGFTVASVLVATGALVWRRSDPLVAQVVAVLAVIACQLAGPIYVLFFGSFVPIAVATFSTARHGRGRVPLAGASVTAAALVLVDIFVPQLQEPGEIVFHWSVMALVWTAGFVLAAHERRSREATARASAVEVAAAEQAMAAVVAERARIAREMHDVVAHAVSVIVVQAGAAELVVRDDPDHVRSALATIRDKGNEALAEMRRAVSILRDDEEIGLAPQPMSESLPQLIESIERTGIRATFRVRGERDRLPAGLDLAIYRIVQEALTNVRKHARATHVAVTLTYGRHEVIVEIVDDGAAAVNGSSSGPSGGHGLIGMRERARIYGGVLETSSDSGFTVRATLPLADTPIEA